LNKFHLQKEISFIPPDGSFELMSYRVENMLKPLFFVKVHEKKANNRVTIKVVGTSNFRMRCDA
jgi:AP-1 complex subunit mu